jgi:DNA modification methylase
MPESVKDRPTKAHEYLFLLSKSQKYFYDAEAIKENSIDDESYSGRRPRNQGKMNLSDPNNYKFHGSVKNGKLVSGQTYPKRNKRTVWTIPTQPTPEAHFATFPRKLIEPCILAGSPKGGVVLDPFFGSGTTGIVAHRHGRNFIGIELSEKYLNDIAVPKIKNETKQRKLF